MDEAQVLTAHEQNRRSWNAATPAHQSHKLNQAAFFRSGGSTLFAEEADLLGRLDGLSVAHLLCNCGQDSLSLAQLGAVRIVGVDICDAAIEEARQLSADAGISASFVRADVLQWLESYSGTRFDVVFLSYGWLAWLGDLRRWARGVSSLLKPDGRLVLVEFHPLAWSLGEGGTLTGDAYFEDAPGGRCDEPAGVSDYVAGSADGLIPEGMGWAVGELNCQPRARGGVPAYGRRPHQRACGRGPLRQKHARVPIQQRLPAASRDEAHARPPLCPA